MMEGNLHRNGLDYSSPYVAENHKNLSIDKSGLSTELLLVIE